ncbi:MAG: hypothetical protein J3K34DRAFT_454038, partial [Monoraphidium minutum]
MPRGATRQMQQQQQQAQAQHGGDWALPPAWELRDEGGTVRHDDGARPPPRVPPAAAPHLPRRTSSSGSWLDDCAAALGLTQHPSAAAHATLGGVGAEEMEHVAPRAAAAEGGDGAGGPPQAHAPGSLPAAPPHAGAAGRAALSPGAQRPSHLGCSGGGGAVHLVSPLLSLGSSDLQAIMAELQCGGACPAGAAPEDAGHAEPTRHVAQALPPHLAHLSDCAVAAGSPNASTTTACGAGAPRQQGPAAAHAGGRSCAATPMGTWQRLLLGDGDDGG